MLLINRKNMYLVRYGCSESKPCPLTCASSAPVTLRDGDSQLVWKTYLILPLSYTRVLFAGQ